MDTRCGEHLLALMVSLTCFRRLGYFPRWADVPVEVVEHLRRCLGLAEGTLARCEARNVKAQRQLVHERLGVVHDPRRARAVAADAIRSAAEAKNNPPDLINVALEMLVKASLEWLALHVRRAEPEKAVEVVDRSRPRGSPTTASSAARPSASA